MVRIILILFTMAAAALALRLQTAESRLSAPASEKVTPEVRTATAFGVSPKVNDLAKPSAKSGRTAKIDIIENGPLSPTSKYPENITHDRDAALAQSSAMPMPTPLLSFDGLSNYDNIPAYNALIIPPDMTGDVGPAHYVQAVNSLVRVYDKAGNPLTPPFKLSDLFAPLGTQCSIRHDGLAIVLYDPLADRWLLSQYCTAFPPFRQMIAVSRTGDPTGAYFIYEFVMPNIRLNDFAKFGVWTDGYYMSTEEYTGSDYSGSGLFAFDRAKILAGDPSASYIYFSRPSRSTARLGNFLPTDLDGLRPPLAGSPDTFISYSATEYGDAQDAIRLFDFHADFANPLNSTFTERPESPLAVAAFDPTSPDGRQDIAQPPPGDFLDSNSDRLNYRAAYRNLGSRETLVVNQTVRISPAVPYRAGVRVYELRRSGGAYSVTEQSTIGDGTSSRWIGGVAEDNQGNIAVGYNFVSDQKVPLLFYTGRLATEPAGTFRNEGSMVIGTGVQKAFGWRWGDYSGMSVDPADDCTFWMTGEYYTLASEQFSDFTWLTRIGAFKFPECTPAPRSVITGVVTNSATGAPITAAAVTASVYSRGTANDGSYGSMYVVPGAYMVSASAHGFRTQTVNISPANGQTVTQNFALQPVAVIENAGTRVSAESCGINGAPDPGETVTIDVSLRNTGSVNTQNLIATLVAAGGVTNPGLPQNYGAIPVNGNAVSRPFTFTVSPTLNCGGTVTMTIQLQDGVENLGTISVPLQTGAPRIALRQDFDRTQQAHLPERWTRSSVEIQPEFVVQRNWTVSASRSRSAPKSAYSPDPIHPGVNEMVTPVFLITSANARLTFQNWYELETTFLRNRLYDGSVLEIKIAGGDWNDILVAGGAFESGGYDGTIDSCCQNPLHGRQGWSGRSGVNETSEFITTSVRLPASAAGQFVQLRWRVGTDIGTFREGQYIDDVLVTDGFTCGCGN